MGHVNTVFHQILAFARKNRFSALVARHDADRYVKSFTAWSHLVTMLFAQATGKDSLRDLEAAFNVQANNLYHLGAKPVRKSTLSDANNRRPWELFQQMYMDMLARFQDLRPGHSFKFKNPLFSIDSTVIDLCLETFPWAKFRARKGAIKMHHRLSHDGMIPEVIVVTDGKKHDVKVAPELVADLQPDSIISMDRAYIDYKFLHSLDKKGVFFVTRAKRNIEHRIVGQHQPPKNNNVVADVLIELTGPKTSENYPERMRMIIFIDPVRKKRLVFITNNFKLAASTIAEIYKARWQIEIFFKWIKQNLKIKSFLGTSKNAVMIQIWCAMIYYLILAFIKAQSRYPKSLHILTQIIEAVLFVRTSLFELLDLSIEKAKNIKDPPPLQMKLPDVV